METINEYIDDAKSFAERHGVSPSQLKDIMEKEPDMDFWRDKILEAKNDPDIEYLVGKYKLQNPPAKSHSDEQFIISLFRALSLGDAIGSVYEFRQHEPITELRIGRGKMTDDSILAAAVRCALYNNPQNPRFRDFFLKAYEKYPNLDYGGGFIRWAQGEIDNSKGYHSAGNGCLPRVVCIPAFYDKYETALYTAIDSCMVTHNSTDAVKATILWVNSLWLALSATDTTKAAVKQKIYDMVRSAYQYSECNKSNKDYDFDSTNQPCLVVSDNSLFAGYALCMVIDAFYRSENATECLLTILQSFCDADTICALASALWFAFDQTVVQVVGENSNQP